MKTLTNSLEGKVDQVVHRWIEPKPVDGGGNAARAGLKAGDQVLYTSSFYGDELWAMMIYVKLSLPITEEKEPSMMV
ncbi:hypothetical protein JHK84_050456 [Glycine max]|nr:hypothetical protein JHK84_050456 [Glycine max]